MTVEIKESAERQDPTWNRFRFLSPCHRHPVPVGWGQKNRSHYQSHRTTGENQPYQEAKTGRENQRDVQWPRANNSMRSLPRSTPMWQYHCCACQPETFLVHFLCLTIAISGQVPASRHAQKAERGYTSHPGRNKPLALHRLRLGRRGNASDWILSYPLSLSC